SIVAAGALAVGIGVAVTSHGSASAQNSGQPGGIGGQGAPGQLNQGGAQAGPGAGGFGPMGGATGGQLVMGTVTAVGTDSITVKTTAATTSYSVTSSTQVVVDGAT